jgi:hypothetical protein
LAAHLGKLNVHGALTTSCWATPNETASGNQSGGVADWGCVCPLPILNVQQASRGRKRSSREPGQSRGRTNGLTGLTQSTRGGSKVQPRIRSAISDQAKFQYTFCTSSNIVAKLASPWLADC